MIDYEAEYNNMTKVPECRAIIGDWVRDAAAFRASHAYADLDVAYGERPRQKLDLFWPDARRAGPMALFIHGGYWQRLDKSFSSHLAAGLLANGVAVAMPSYDLCPDVQVADIVDQMREVVAFLPNPVLAVGHSAGGHMAAMLLADGLVPAALPISGLFYLPPLIETSMNVAMRLDQVEARRLSPMTLPAPSGRLHAVVGGDEGIEFTRQTRGIAEAWGGTWDSLPGLNHFTIVSQLADPHSAIVAAARRLMA